MAPWPTDAQVVEEEPSAIDVDASGVKASMTAPMSEDAAGNMVDYSAAYVVDGDSHTAWRAEGDGIGYELVVNLGAEYHLTEVGLIPGYAKTEGEIDRFHQNRRILSVVWDFADGLRVTQDFEDAAQMQSIPIDATSNWVRVHIDATSEDGGRDYVAISDIALVGMPVTN